MWTPSPLPEWLDSVQSAQRWIVPELVGEDSIVLIDGPRKRGKKTFWANTLALCVATGRPLPIEVEAPQHIERAPVLYIEEEGARGSTKERWMKQIAGMKLEPAQLTELYYSHRAGVRLDSPDWPETVTRFATKFGVKLVILDAFNYMFTGDENSSAAVKLPLQSVRDIRQVGTSVMLLHHVGKSTSVTGKEREVDMDDRSRGSTAIVDAYDNHHAMVPSAAPYVLMSVRHRDAEEGGWEMHWHFEDHRIQLRMRRHYADVVNLAK